MTAVPAPPSTFYVCPGERHAISRSVHWGRLAAFYEKCRHCEHRGDTGLLPREVATVWDRRPHSARQALEFTADGVRGRYLNELDRAGAHRFASAFAHELWNRRPLRGRVAETVVVPPVRSQTTGPTIVVGYDERPSSPDLAVGLVTALRQMGCRVIDMGRATKPMWQFAARRTRADGGLFVTGAGCDPAWTGFDVLSPAGTSPHDLADRMDGTPQRPTRAAGSVQSLAIADDYAASLPPYFHALRPLRVVCATPLETLQFVLPRLFQRLPCELTCQPWPRQRRSTDGSMRGGERVAAQVRDRAADVGMLIDEDGQTCDVWDERGISLSRTIWQAWLIDRWQAVEAGRLTLDDQQRLWRHECNDSACDGVITLGTLLQALSLSDAPLSQQMPQ